MEDYEIIDLYNKGHSIDFIVDKISSFENFNNRILVLKNRKVLFVNTDTSKQKIRGRVYKVLYKYIMQENKKTI